MQLFKTERPVSLHSGKRVNVTPESQKAGARLCCSALWLQDPVLEMSFSLWSWAHTPCMNGWISVKRWANCGLLMKLFWWDQKQGQPHCRPPHCVVGGTSPRTEGFPIPSWPWEMHIQRPRLEVRGEENHWAPLSGGLLPSFGFMEFGPGDRDSCKGDVCRILTGYCLPVATLIKERQLGQSVPHTQTNLTCRKVRFRHWHSNPLLRAPYGLTPIPLLLVSFPACYFGHARPVLPT